MFSKSPLVATRKKLFKEGINEMKSKPEVVDKAITHTTEKNKNDTANKTYKPQAYNIKKDKFISNELKKSISSDKSRLLDRSKDP